MPSSIRMIGFFLSPSNYNKLLNVSTFFYLWRVLLIQHAVTNAGIPHTQVHTKIHMLQVEYAQFAANGK